MSTRIYRGAGGLSYSANLRIVAPQADAPCQRCGRRIFPLLGHGACALHEVVQMKTAKDTRENYAEQSQLSIAPEVGQTTETRSEFNLTVGISQSHPEVLPDTRRECCTGSIGTTMTK
ncbi:hypothetical protein [Pandoraea oxalativorans]|uniref:hypothetical protein n=1 Tax=Pandoraea oxalativorans TaxID=573737 RepID=UPI000A890E8D|nr:hypothetical protein [Pandoraea oxalativorans]